MKTKQDKDVTKAVKRLNRELRLDCFRDRFEIKIKSKNGYADDHSVHHYHIQLIDNIKPENNQVVQLSSYSYKSAYADLCEFITKFIQQSGFWKEIYETDFFETHEICLNCKEGTTVYTKYYLKPAKLKYKIYYKNSSKNEEGYFKGVVPYCTRCKKQLETFLLHRYNKDLCPQVKDGYVSISLGKE